MNSEGFKKFYSIIEDEYSNKIIYPPKEDIFRALKLTPYNKVKVVVVGQDPYPGINQANGLSFSVYPNVPIPRSLKNIYQEKFFAKYVRNNIQYANISDYIMTLESQVDAIIKRYERHLVNNDLDNALLAKNMIERRKKSIIFLQNSYNSYFEECINKGLNMLEKKELVDEDIQELYDLTIKLLNFESDNKNIRRR